MLLPQFEYMIEINFYRQYVIVCVKSFNIDSSGGLI